jgi:hypothetical protein
LSRTLNQRSFELYKLNLLKFNGKGLSDRTCYKEQHSWHDLLLVIVGPGPQVVYSIIYLKLSGGFRNYGTRSLVDLHLHFSIPLLSTRRFFHAYCQRSSTPWSFFCRMQVDKLAIFPQCNKAYSSANDNLQINRRPDIRVYVPRSNKLLQTFQHWIKLTQR